MMNRLTHALPEVAITFMLAAAVSLLLPTPPLDWVAPLSMQVQAGVLPLWLPDPGMPALARVPLLYPLTGVFFIMPAEAAFRVFVAAHLSLTGCGVLVLAKRHRLTFALFAIIGALGIAALMGYKALAAVAWLPFMLLALMLTLRQAPGLGGRPASLPWVAVGAAALGLSALAGSVAGLALVVGTLLLVTALRPAALKRRVWVAVMLTLGIALGMAQLLPTFTDTHLPEAPPHTNLPPALLTSREADLTEWEAVPILTDTGREVTLNVITEREAVLILTRNYAPGWRAFQGDGSEIPLRPSADHTLQIIPLEAGNHSLRLTYSPDSLRYGGFISFMASMLIAFAGGVYVWRYAYRDDTDDSVARRLAKNSLAPIALNLFNRGIQFAFAVVYLRVLGPVGAGQYQYAVIIFGWFEILSNFGLDTLVMREVSRDKQSANRWLVNTTVIRLSLALLGVPLLMAFLASREVLTGEPLAPQTLTAIWLLYIGLFISTVNKGLTGLFYAYEKAEYPAATQTISTMLTASLGLVALLTGLGIVGLAGVSIIVNVITFGILLGLTVHHFFRPYWQMDWPLQREAMGESFPLMVNHLLATLFFRIDIILLEALKGALVVGWYGVVYKWIDAINVIPAFFTQALFPVMSRLAAEDMDALRRYYRFAIKLMTLISLPTAVVTTLLAEILIGVLAGPEYLPFSAIALQIFVWSIPIGWINSVTNYVIIALDRQRILTWAFVGGAVFNIGGNLYFIPRFNYPAAAVMTILSELVLLAFFYMVMLRPFGRINWVRLLWKFVLATALMAGVAWVLAPISLWLTVPTCVLVYGAAVWLLRPFNAFEQSQINELNPLSRVSGK